MRSLLFGLCAWVSQPNFASAAPLRGLSSQREVQPHQLLQKTNRTNVMDQPTGSAACKYCRSTSCADGCYTGKCMFTGVLKTATQDMCAAWTWSCGKVVRGYTHCDTYDHLVKQCGICRNGGGKDCYAGKCEKFCSKITFNDGPVAGMVTCKEVIG
eukprot:gnl/MRDRNA2_/MRDRNA2_61321_c0_seq1.p1 gnl/MRDRNA2_/MRDRNA2_61321_c0~~gnl/MRDRNA2_/MRDRNA2_61321_c0_seq1.p1  ORF type:complete len:156 (-),score=15.42 gnl/MRDRNA2_/MRDRNA2_61321_c0_seq1:53-520(-)